MRWRDPSRSREWGAPRACHSRRQTYTSSSSPKTYVTNWDDLGEEEQAEVDERGAYHNLVDAQAAADSEALKGATEKASQTHKYSVVEVKTKTKYWLNPDNTTDSDSATGSGSISLSLSNTLSAI